MNQQLRGCSNSRTHYKPLSAAQKGLNHARAAAANIRRRKIGRRGTAMRSVIKEHFEEGRWLYLHATKGWQKRSLGVSDGPLRGGRP